MRRRNPYAPRVTPFGVIQAGVYSPDHPMAQGTLGAMHRGVVLAVYTADDASWQARGVPSSALRGVYADVRLTGRQTRTLQRVPVLQHVHGMHDLDVYIPRATRQDSSSADATLITQGAAGERSTAAHVMDGDTVIVGFLENDPGQPVILPFQLGHSSSATSLTRSLGRRRQIRHNGVNMLWDEQGNLTIDASEAAKDELGPAGAEISNTGAGGTITIKTKDVAGRTSTVTIDAQGNAVIDAATITFGGTSSQSTEPFVCGNLLKQLLGEILTQIAAITVNTAFGPSSPPTNFAAFQAFKARMDAGEPLSGFIFGRKTK